MRGEHVDELFPTRLTNEIFVRVRLHFRETYTSFDQVYFDFISTRILFRILFPTAFRDAT